MRGVVLAVVLLFVFVAPTWADMESGVAAYNRGDYNSAIQELGSFAEKGNSRAQSILGNMYVQGKGVTQDYAQAVKWFHKAAKQGHAEAQYNLGLAYERGKGLMQDHAEAVKWFREAAEQGYSSGQYNLGLAYYNNQGVGRDYVQAYMWLALAAAQGDKVASEVCNLLAKEMTPAQIAQAQEMARNWKPRSETAGKAGVDQKVGH